MHGPSIALLVFAAVFPIVSLNTARAATATFQWLGNVPGQAISRLGESVYSISDDSWTIAGDAVLISKRQAFRWSSTDGISALGDLPGGIFDSQARGLSADGSVAVGFGYSASGQEAFRWTSAGGLVGLGDLPGGTFFSLATDVSNDGLTVVGEGVSASGHEAYRWTSDGGIIGLGDLPGGIYESGAIGISGDGSVIVGLSSSGVHNEAFRWTIDEGMVGLGTLPGFASTMARAASFDGSVIVGEIETIQDINSQPFRWTVENGMIALGHLLPGGQFTRALDVSADGSVVVGSSYAAETPSMAYRWTTKEGMASVQDLLEVHGVTDAGIGRLFGAAGVSADGRTIMGWGIDTNLHTNAWIATIPVPESPAFTMSAIGFACVFFAVVRRHINERASKQKKLSG